MNNSKKSKEHLPPAFFCCRHSTRLAICRFCIFIQEWSDWVVFCKLLDFKMLSSAF